jgi:hypothetical protein
VSKLLSTVSRGITLYLYNESAADLLYYIVSTDRDSSDIELRKTKIKYKNVVLHVNWIYLGCTNRIQWEQKKNLKTELISK